MQALYNLGIHAYTAAIKVAANFNKKARLLNHGRKNTWSQLEKIDRKGKKLIWFHAASLGEFEQGRPLIEMIKEHEPKTQILLTFFSPSGYEIRKNYKEADYIVYLPADTPYNAKRFIDRVKPDIAIFIKYEFWYNLLYQLHKQTIPTYIISAIFREDQPFFKSWGTLHREMLGFFDHLFVQDQESQKRLAQIGIHQVTLTGDTRFDRVQQIATTAKDIERVAIFCNNKSTIVCGSTWPQDEVLLFEYINNNGSNHKWVVAPHEIHESHIQSILARCEVPAARFSDVHADLSKARVLIIDCIGLLSSIYRYGQIAYIGGGFGVGIHNTLEAAVYGMPIIFGPKYQKFNEAIELVREGAAFSVKNQQELNDLFNTFNSSPTAIQQGGQQAERYVKSQLGATELIYTNIKNIQI